VSDAAGLKVIFVAGAGRSGSTLLDRLLGTAPGVCAVGELRQIWRLGFRDDAYCGCGERFRGCPFWREVVTRAFGSFDAVDGAARYREQEQLIRVRNAMRLAWPRRLPTALRVAAARWRADHTRLLAAVAETAGATTIVDSTKNPMYGLLLASMEGVDMRTVHLVRDSRAVAYSWAERLKYEPTEDSAQPLFKLRPHRDAARWWTFANLGTELAPPLHRHYRRVFYEDFAARPASELAALCRFAGIPEVQPLPGSSTEFDFGGVHHSIGGNPVRFQKGAVTIRADEEWRTALARGPRRQVTAYTFPLLLGYGYLLGRRGRR